MSRTIAAAPPPPATRILADKVEDVRMMGDRILIKPLDWEPSKIISVVRNGRPLKGEVMAVGPGHHPMKYKKGPKGPKQFMEYSRHFRPTEVKVGDIVELGGLNQFDGVGYQFPEFVVGSETMLVITERDVAAVHCA
jgi:hypothetical protein